MSTNVEKGRILNFKKYANEFTSTLHKSIAQEFVDEAWERFNVTVDDDLALWLVKLLTASPNQGIRANTSFEHADVDNLIGKCLENISDPNSVFVATVKLQIFYMKHEIDGDRIVANYKATIETKMNALTQAIMDTSLRTKNQCEDYLKKMAVDAIVQYSLGDPSNVEVIGETINALKSVMSTNDIMKLSLLAKQEKRESIVGLRDIVCGIRIFNKDAGHCGEGLIDMEETIRNGCVATKLQLTNSQKVVKECIRLLLLDYKTNEKPMGDGDGNGDGDSKHDIVKLIMLYRQSQQMHDDLYQALLDEQFKSDRLLINFRNCLARIHNTVKYRTAIAIEHIFPKFIELAKIWQQLEYKLIIMSEINTVNEQLMLLSDVVAKRDEIAAKLVERDGTVNIETKSKKGGGGGGGGGGGDGIIAKSTAAEPITVFAHQDKMKLEYNGFCAWTLSTTNGLLLPVDTSIGIICHRNQFYGFASIDAANRFQENIDVCLHGVRDVIRENPELLIVLNVYQCSHGDESIQIANDQSVVGRQSIVSSCSSVEIQTETHPIAYHKDYSYVWNKWDLRRQAITLADIQRKRTHATQSIVTFHRNASGTQTYADTDNSNQTDADVKTQTPYCGRPAWWPSV